MIWILLVAILIIFIFYSRKIFYRQFLIENCIIHPSVAKKIDTDTAIKIKNHFDLAIETKMVSSIDEIKKITDESHRIMLLQHINSEMKFFIATLIAAGNTNKSVKILAYYYEIKKQDIVDIENFNVSITGNKRGNKNFDL